MNNTLNQTIGFIGGGNMAQAIIRGLLNAGHPANRIAVADPGDASREAVAAINSEMLISTDNKAVAEASDVLVLATKPQYITEVATEISDSKPGLVISIAAGITLDAIESALDGNTAVVRIMPNTPALVGKGMAGLVGNSAVAADQKAIADYIVDATGEAVWLDDECMMDAVTAISGSGPAYFFLIMELLTEGARSFGFSDEVAQKLAVQTALGAATLADAEGIDPEELRRRVTSPNGTTEAACNSLLDSGIKDTFQKALEAARDRSIELGKG